MNIYLEEIKKYYKDLSFDTIISIIEMCESNDNVLNLFSLTTKHNFYLFKLKTNRWSLKTNKEIISKTEKKRKRLIDNYCQRVKETKNNDNFLTILEDENKFLTSSLVELDEIIDLLTAIDIKSLRSVTKKSYNFIASFTN